MGGFWPTVDVDPPEVPESIGGCVHCEKDLYADRGVLTVDILPRLKARDSN